MLYLPVIGVVPVPLCVPPGQNSGMSASMPAYGNQLAGPFGHRAPYTKPLQLEHVCEFRWQPPNVHLSWPLHRYHLPAQLQLQKQPQPGFVERTHSFKSLEILYEVVTYRNAMSGTLSYSAMTQADPLWRKGPVKRYFELDSAVKEMTKRAVANAPSKQEV